MLSVGLPSIMLWQGMQNRASGLPHLMQDAIQENSTPTLRRVSACLQQLAALGGFVQAVRLSLYCRECNKLLGVYKQQVSHRERLAPLLLGAAVRVSQSFNKPLECLIDSDHLNEIRQARGGSVIRHAAAQYRATWAVPKLKILLRKQLTRAHYTLDDNSNKHKPSSASVQPRSIASLNRVAALWLGNSLLEQVKHIEHFRPTCLQVLRLEMCSKRTNEGAPPTTFSAMQQIHLALATQKLLNRLREEVRALLLQEHEIVNIERSLAAFHRVNACCAFFTCAQAIDKISVSALQLALHLRCWKQNECEASALLCLCVLALERHLDIAIAKSLERRPCEHVDIRLRRKVQHFIRTHRRRIRAAYAVPVNNVRAFAYKELQGIHRELRKSFKLNEKIGASVDDALFHALIRCKGIVLYMGEVALYELLLNFRQLVVLAIERKLRLTKNLIALLPRLSAYCLRSFQRERRDQAYEASLLIKLAETVRMQRQRAFLQFDMIDSRVRLRTPQQRGKNSAKRSIATKQLPSFLASNIRGLVAEPIAVYRCLSTQEFTEISRTLLLELALLAQGARALQVERVAALSEVMLEVYRALMVLPVLPEQRVLERNLQAAHRCLRLALNQAAARQTVCDVRPTIVSLYHFLERLHRGPVHSTDPMQATLSAVNALVADMRAFGDVFVSLANQGRGSRYQLAREQLQGLIATTRHLQEELGRNGMIGIARWRVPLLNTARRYSNERSKPVHLVLLLDEIEASRPLVEKLQTPLQALLCLMIEHSVESTSQRRCVGKPESACLRVSAERLANALIISLEDDGSGLEMSQLTRVTEQIEALGGSLLLADGAASGSRVNVRIP